MLNKKTLSSKIAVAGLIILLFFLADIKFRQWQAQKQIEAQKLSLEVQADQLQKKNNELNQSLQYLNSPSFKERVARENLGLKKTGEVVYSFGQDQAQTDNTGQQPVRVSNVEKWWNYFLNYN